MQKFIPLEFDYYITADGDVHNLHEISGGSFGFVLMDLGGHGMPPINYQTQRGPYQDGTTLLDYFLEPRVIQMIVRFSGKSRRDYWDARSRLIDWFRPNRHGAGSLDAGVLRKIMPDGKKRDLNVFVERGPAFDIGARRWDEFGFTQDVRFVAHNPVFYDPDTGMLDVTLPSTTDLVFAITFPIIFGSTIIDDTSTITYLGTWVEYPQIIITGPLNGMSIANQTTGETIELSYNIPSGRTVTIDLAYGVKSIEDDLGTNLLGVVTADSDLATWHLAPDPEAPNGVNTIHVSGSGADKNTTIRVQYNNRYIGF